MAAAAAEAVSQKDKASAASVFVEDVTVSIRLHIKNSTDSTLEVNWLNYEGQPVNYGSLAPKASTTQTSFSTHPWRFDCQNGNSVTYLGGSAVLEVLPGGQLMVKPYPDDNDTSWQDPAWGQYKQRGTVLGMPIMAYECVGRDAVQEVVRVVTRMLEGCKPQVLTRMVAAGCNIAIIGRDQVTTDIPPHHFMKSHSRCDGPGDIDATTRGLGATADVPTSSCGEENITMVDDRKYHKENILIHELGHAVMNLGFDEAQLQWVHKCYTEAKRQGLYTADCYMMFNAEEYWAEGCQTWFDATIRTDVNSGINTRDKLKAHDTHFAQLLDEVFGDGSWRYPQTAPAAFGHHSRSRGLKARHGQQQQQQQQQEEQQPKHKRPQKQQRGRQQHPLPVQHPLGTGKQKRKHSKEQPAEAAATTCFARLRTRATTALQRLTADGPKAALPTETTAPVAVLKEPQSARVANSRHAQQRFGNTRMSEAQAGTKRSKQQSVGCSTRQ